MRRRDFLTALASSAAGVCLCGEIWSLQAVKRRRLNPAAGSDKRRRIAVSTWSLHNYFAATREKEFNLPGSMLALLDFPEMIADRYRVHQLEFCAPHFASTEQAYLRELRSNLRRARSNVVNIPVDIEELWTEGGLSDPDQRVRENALRACMKWIDIAHAVGSRAVRCDPGRLNASNLAPTIASYKALAAYGESKGVRVLVENHGGVGSERPEELVRLFRAVGSNYFGALPDFANFPDEPTREKGLRLLFPFAHIVCHAKALEFDAEGNETQFNFPKCMEVAKKAAFRGVYSIEFEGSGDPYSGIQKCLDQLVRLL